jgi:hypothetical protein
MCAVKKFMKSTANVKLYSVLILWPVYDREVNAHTWLIPVLQCLSSCVACGGRLSVLFVYIGIILV